MHSRTEHARPKTSLARPRLFTRVAAMASVVVGLVTTLTVLAPAGGAAATTAPAGTAAVVSSESSPFGKVLMVGSGQFAGYSLYAFDRNMPGACTTTTVTVGNMPLSCAGPETDKTADWPVLTTVGKPVAGPGVDKHLLGMVYRKDIKADQVTYAGKLLYLFDTGPHMFAGENFMETVLPLPPWHGLWYLVAAADGQPAVGSIAVTTQTVPNGPAVLAAAMFQGLGAGTPIVVYTYSKDKKAHSACTAQCALSWPPVLTTAPLQAGTLPVGALGEIKRSDGTEQLTYHGKPLYFYASEVPQLNPTTGMPLNPATTGTGNGLSVSGGTFSTVPAPAS